MECKLKLLVPFSLCLLLVLSGVKATSQQVSDEMLNLLINKGVIAQNDADSLRAVLAIKAQDEKAKQKKFPIATSKAFTLNGYLQARFQSQQEAGKKDGFDIRRARLDLKGAISPKWDYRLQLEFAGSPKILDAVIAYKYADYFKISAGQFKVPFSMENLMASNKLECIDRSQVVEALSARGKDVIGNHNGRDLGVQISGSLLKINDLYLIDYSLGVFDGEGINVPDSNEKKDYAARLIFHPCKGLDFGGSYYDGTDWRKTAKADLSRKRIAAEMSYVKNNLSLRGEFIKGQDDTINRSGWYLQAGYFVIPKKFQVLLKYDTYDTDLDIAKNIKTNYICCLNYMFNDFTRLQAAYTYRKEEGDQVNNDIIALQLQIGF